MTSIASQKSVLPELPDEPFHAQGPPEASILVFCVKRSFLLGEHSSCINSLLNFPNEGKVNSNFKKKKYSF